MKCPHCNMEIQTRAEIGKGTQKGKLMKINFNRQCILDVLKASSKPLDVRSVQHALVDSKIRRQSQRGAGWNYHTIQADLSILVGMGKVKMTDPMPIEIWNTLEGHTTTKVPHYTLMV